MTYKLVRDLKPGDVVSMSGQPLKVVTIKNETFKQSKVTLTDGRGTFDYELSPTKNVEAF